MTDEAKLADQISRRLWPTVSKALGGQPTMVQGAVLADLAAIWLAGHIVKGDAVQTEALREELLELHVAAIRSLIALYGSKGTA